MNDYTPQQRKALHKFCEKLSEELNEAGFDMRTVLNEDVEIPWTKESVKEHLYKPILKAMYDKDSTEDQETVNPAEVHKVLMRHLGEKFGIPYIDWPSNR